MKKILSFLFLFILSLSVNASFLMPEQAFSPSVKLNDKMQLEVQIDLAKDIYLYEEYMGLVVKGKNEIFVKDIKSSEAVNYHGTMVYLVSPSFLVTLEKKPDVKGVKTIEFELLYQGCSKQGLCYEPLSKTYTFDIDTSKLHVQEKPKLKSLTALVKEQKPQEQKQKTKIQEVKPSKELSQTDKIVDVISSSNLVMIILTFLGFGILLSLTPCVFPMIPIISGIIISHGENITTKKAFVLSLVYVLAMAVAYTIAGVLAGLFGSNLQATLQNPWVIVSFSAIFVALAMSMFGFYELKLPDSFVAKVSGSRNIKGYTGVAIMGFLSALIVGPCVAAPLAGALVYIGQTGDAILGGMALFAMGIGMGLPLIVVGVSAGKFMPKPGVWMTMVSVIFGVMMLGVAIWMLERILDAYIIMILWALLAVGFSIYLGAFKSKIHMVQKTISILMFIYGVALFIGALGGSTSMSKPLGFISSADISHVEKKQDLEFSHVASIKELDELLLKHKGKKVLLDFSADWCTACKELEEETFSHPHVQDKMNEFILIRADVTDNTDKQKALSKKYGVFGPPAIIFFDENSKVKKSKTIIGFIEAQKFLKHLEF